MTPYAASGIMFQKFKMLSYLTSHTTRKLNFSEFLTKTEICYLHKLISSGVDSVVRGDEHRACPIRGISHNEPSRPDPFNRRRTHVNT